MNLARLLQFFETRKSRNEPLVLVTVYETQGSTYSKAGAHMLVDGNGIFQGMLSGGCLEGDLAIRAQIVIESGNPQSVTYDLGTDDDEVWGLGVGCDGLMRVFLQPLRADSDYQPFAAIADALQAASNSVVATIIESAAPLVPVGAAVLVRGDEIQSWRMDSALVSDIAAEARAVLQKMASRTTHMRAGDKDIHVLLAVVEIPPRVLVLGAGPDAEPVVRFAAELGWRCTIVDHRQAYVDTGEFPGAEAIHCIEADKLSASLDLAIFDMAIVMSHHLVSDRSYLRQLAATDIGYIGLLGPGNRRQRLLSDLGVLAESLRDRLRGPAGLDIGGRGPAPIALSIIAQMQAEIRRPGDS